MGTKLNIKVVTAGLLLVIFALATGIRLWGIDFGLPYEYHPDEWLYVRQAARMGDQGLEPSMWNNPPFFKYILLGEYGALFLFGKLAGWYSSAADFGVKSTADPTMLFLLGRITSALIGAFTVFLIYRLGREVSGRRVGLMSALFLAVAFLHVRSSHFAVNDTAVTFLVTLALLAAVMIAKTGQKKWYFIGAAALGIGFSTKYSALIAVLPLLFAHFIAPKSLDKKEVFWRLAIIPVVAFVTAILASPYFIITPDKVVADIKSMLLTPGLEGFNGWEIDRNGGYVFFLKTLVWELNWVLAICIGAGFIVGAISRSKVIWVLLALIVPHYLFIGAQKMFFARFLLPALPGLLVLGAYAIHQGANRYFRAPKINQFAFIALGIIACAWPLIASLQYDTIISRTDTRTLAKMWIEENIPENSIIWLEWPWHTPQLAKDDKEVAQSTHIYQAHYMGGAGVSDFDLDFYRRSGIQYLVISSFIYDIPLNNKLEQQQRTLYYASMGRSFKQIAHFSPFDEVKSVPFIFEEVYGPVITLWDRSRPGPVLTIYEVE